MSFPYSTVILDVDGTLVDSNDAHARAWVECLRQHGHDVTFPRVRPLIGLGGDRLIEQLTGLARDSAASEDLSHARGELFRAKYVDEVRPLDGARELVLGLRERELPYAIASAAKSPELEVILEAGGIADLMTIRTTSSDVDHTKPAPDIVTAALAQLGAPPEGAVMVGDTPYDVIAARAAGIAIIGVTSGGWTADELHGCAAVYRGPRELLQKL